RLARGRGRHRPCPSRSRGKASPHGRGLRGGSRPSLARLPARSIGGLLGRPPRRRPATHRARVLRGSRRLGLAALVPCPVNSGTWCQYPSTQYPRSPRRAQTGGGVVDLLARGRSSCFRASRSREAISSPSGIAVRPLTKCRNLSEP